MVCKEPELEASWKAVLLPEFHKPYFAELKRFLIQENSAGHKIFPPGKEIFNAFACTPLPQVKVVILGQDPYHGDGQAHGRCFSVRRGTAPPPSLVNIFTELNRDVGVTIPQHGDLTAWAQQGVLLLNTVLTVRAHVAHSHRNKGWEVFTNKVIEILNTTCNNLIFVLWGAPAKEKLSYIDHSKHLVLTAAHPSPLSAYRGFFGCRHFSKINNYLQLHHKQPIDWQLP